MGAPDGDNEGPLDEWLLGRPEGRDEGLPLEVTLGPLDGSPVGLVLAPPVGVALSSWVGLTEPKFEGSLDGGSSGLPLDFCVCDSVGLALG